MDVGCSGLDAGASRCSGSRDGPRGEIPWARVRCGVRVGACPVSHRVAQVAQEDNTRLWRTTQNGREGDAATVDLLWLNRRVARPAARSPLPSAEIEISCSGFRATALAIRLLDQWDMGSVEMTNSSKVTVSSRLGAHPGELPPKKVLNRKLSMAKSSTSRKRSPSTDRASPPSNHA